MPVHCVVVNANHTSFQNVGGLYVCPSNPSGGATACSYRYNFGGDTPFAGGDGVSVPPHSNATSATYVNGKSVLGNGAFTRGRGLKHRDFVDGLSKTACFSERVTGTGKTYAAGPAGEPLDLQRDTTTADPRDGSGMPIDADDLWPR